MLEEFIIEMQERAEAARLRAERAREQFREALEKRQVGDPISSSLIATFIISAAFSVGSSLLTAALTPRQKVTQGDRGGQELGIQRSAQGTGIPEVYGGDPGDGLGGGIKIAPIVAWLSRTEDGYTARKHVTTEEVGGKGFTPSQEVERITYDLDALLLWCRGPATLTKLWAATKLILRQRGNGSTNIYEAEDGGNALAGGAAVVADADASGGSAVDIPQNGSLRWNAVAGDGTGVTLLFYYKSTERVSVEFTWVGAAGTTVFNESINSTNGEYVMGYSSAPWRLFANTSNTVKVKNLSSGVIRFDRLGVRLPGDPVGVPNPAVGGDSPYSPETPPDPGVDYTLPRTRSEGALDIDPDTLGLVGSLTAGNYSGIAVYEGNGTELPDPVVSAEVDGRLGAGSTPAYRHVATTRLSNFYLTEYQEAFPPFWGLLEHKTIRTFGQLCAHLCERVGLTSDEYDFSDLESIPIRGVAVSPPYTPRELMTTLAKLYNCYFYESDKIYGLRMESAPTFELTDADLGWVDEVDEDAETLPELTGELAAETEIPRRVTVRYISPGRNYDQNQQNEPRMVTTGQREDTLDVTVTLTDEEARGIAARELYQDDHESTTHRFSLSYEHIYRNPGDVAVITRDEGFVQSVRLTAIKPALGALECEGEAIDTAIFTQPAVAPGEDFEQPPVAVPAMSIFGVYDNGPLLTKHIGQPGFYGYVTPRTGVGVWTSAALYKETPGLPVKEATFTKAATLGVALTKLGSVTNIFAEDSTRVFTADAGTDVLTSTAHEIENDETVTVSNSGGALPGGLSSSTLYHVVGRTANTLQLSLTSGGSAVDVTSAGTGTHSVQRVVDVDLYGTEATLETVTADQIALGDNAFLFGNEVVQVRTWEQIAGYPNRWRGRNFTRGQVNSELAVGSHVAGERVLRLDDAVEFIEQDVAALNVEHTYRAVTSGQSFDDAAQVDFVWTGGALKYPAPSIQGTKDTTSNDWRFLLFGTRAVDQLFKLEVVGGRTFSNLRDAVSRPVSLSTTSALPSDMVPPTDTGKKQYRAATKTGNTVTDSSAYLIQMISGERTAISFTYSTTLDDESVLGGGDNNESTVTFSPGGAYGLALKVSAQTSTHSAKLEVLEFGVAVFTDNDGEATNTRFTVEFKDGKVYFFRDRHVHGNPFYVHTLPAEDAEFPMECQVQAGTDSTLSAIEIDDEGAAVLYLAAEQVEDFGSTQSSLTVRACQQRVVGGVVVDGQVTEVTFP